MSPPAAEHVRAQGGQGWFFDFARLLQVAAIPLSLVAFVASTRLHEPLPSAELSTSVAEDSEMLCSLMGCGEFQVSLLPSDVILWAISNVCYHFGAHTLSGTALSTLHHLIESSQQPSGMYYFPTFVDEETELQEAW